MGEKCELRANEIDSTISLMNVEFQDRRIRWTAGDYEHYATLELNYMVPVVPMGEIGYGTLITPEMAKGPQFYPQPGMPMQYPPVHPDFAQQ